MGKIMYKGQSYAGGINTGGGSGGGGDSTAIPTANTAAKFDSVAHMNSEDMTSQEVSNFVNSLEPSAISIETQTYTNMRAIRSGNVITIKIAGTVSADSAGWYTIDTLDEQFRPSDTVFGVGYNNNDTSWSNSRPVMLAVSPNGNVNVYMFSDKLSLAPRAAITYVKIV